MEQGIQINVRAALIRQRQIEHQRRGAVAALAGVTVFEVEAVKAAEVREACAGRIGSEVLDLMLQEPASYWRVGDVYYFDDPYFGDGDVVAVDNLAYDAVWGLIVR